MNIFYALCCSFTVMFFMMLTVQPPSAGVAKKLITAVWASLILDAAIFLIVFVVFGMMGISGIKLSAIPAVSLIMTVGVAVEFTAHIILAFVVAKGTLAQRTAEALNHMFVPIVNGYISTFLGVFMMSFSDFPFIVLYFFVLYFVIITVGLIIGLVFVPLMLAVVGPSGYEDVDQKSVVPT
jgi:predicted RND superfamily exporter protein